MNTPRTDAAIVQGRPDLNDVVPAEFARGLEREMAGVRVKENFNLAWLVVFLRNAGERIRSVRLVMDIWGISFTEAREWVDSVKIDRVPVSREKARKLHAERPCFMLKEDLEDSWEYKVSHWPATLRE